MWLIEHFELRMSRKRHEWSDDLRNLVVKHHLEGDSVRDVAEKAGISRSTAHNIIQRFKKTGSAANRSRTGRKRKTTAREDRLIRQKILVNRKKGAESVSKELAHESMIEVSAQTVRRRMHEAGYHGHVARKKPYISPKNKVKRLNWARERRHEDMSYWKKILWSDESKFDLFGSDGRQMVWRRSHEAMRPDCLKQTVKHGGGSLMVWGAMSSGGVGNLVLVEGIMKKEDYEKILQENVKGSAKKLKMKQFVFMQDNDPKHTAHTIRDWFAKNKIKKLEWPAQSPDLNPIEHIWDELERRLKGRNPKNKKELWAMMKQEWEGIGKDVTEKLVGSMPKRVLEVIKNKGGPTKY